MLNAYFISHEQETLPIHTDSLFGILFWILTCIKVLMHHVLTFLFTISILPLKVQKFLEKQKRNPRTYISFQ